MLSPRYLHGSFSPRSSIYSRWHEPLGSSVVLPTKIKKKEMCWWSWSEIFWQTRRMRQINSWRISTADAAVESVRWSEKSWIHDRWGGWRTDRRRLHGQTLDLIFNAGGSLRLSGPSEMLSIDSETSTPGNRDDATRSPDSWLAWIILNSSQRLYSGPFGVKKWGDKACCSGVIYIEMASSLQAHSCMNASCRSISRRCQVSIRRPNNISDLQGAEGWMHVWKLRVIQNSHSCFLGFR